MMRSSKSTAKSAVVTTPQSELNALRQGLWQCYALAGGDPHRRDAGEITDAELVPLVLDCVQDLRALFEAARRDTR